LACCSSGWTIPVEPAIERRIATAARTGELRAGDGSPLSAWSRPLGEGAAPRATTGEHARVALRVLESGACVFLDARGTRLCAVHDRLGEDALPGACRQFPRVVTQTPLGVSVTLSHYCPTAAGLLFTGRNEPDLGRAVAPGAPVGADETAPPAGARPAVPAARSGAGHPPADPLLRIVEAPPAFPPNWPFEGLDARSALPPLLRPGVLMSWSALERWEEHATRVLADDGPPEDALRRLAADAERARAWTPSDGEFDAFFAAALGAERRTGGRRGGAEGAEDAPSTPAGAHQTGGRPSLAPGGWSLVAGCVPDTALLPPAPPANDAGLVAAGWQALSAPVRRWLGAKAFASWAALQGEGLRTTVSALAAALEVLRAECARECAESGRPLDAGLLLAAVRRADLLLVHLVDPERLARRLSGCESGRGVR
jgi:Fe-S-cluster containining protein